MIFPVMKYQSQNQCADENAKSMSPGFTSRVHQPHVEQSETRDSKDSQPRELGWKT